MNRIIAGALCASLPLLAACATKVTTTDAPNLPLHVSGPRVPLKGCYVPDNYTSMLNGRRFAVAKFIGEAGKVFENERAFFGTPLDEDCDVRLTVSTMKAGVVAHSARTGRGLFEMKGSFGFDAYPKMHKALVEKFAVKGLVESVLAERSGAAPAPVAEAPAPVNREPLSDVDSPTRRGQERPNDFALVIGIEEYQNVPKADWGVRDAKTVRRHLEAIGFEPRNVVSLVGQQATGGKLKSYLEEWLPRNVNENSTLFVYYSGHGAPDPKNGDAYLVPWDGDPKYLKSTALPLSKLYADLGKTKAKRVIVALDACFSGAGGRSVLAPGARPLVAKAADVPAGERLTVLAAASGDEITGGLDEQGHGLFTYYLLKGLGEGKRSAKALAEYLTPKVQDEARRQNREQTPKLMGADAEL
ncbi:MAG: caspase family protein [Elusimicrobiota bacterium]|nr:MAG: caspase family protein [Elusimicrobiota bacterium]